MDGGWLTWLINLSYIAAAILFIFGIKMLGRAETARRGNMISACGMLLAVLVTLFSRDMSFLWIALGLAIGGGIGFAAARFVKMTGMPEMVALFNGFGGLASVLVAWAEYNKIAKFGWEAYRVMNPEANPPFIGFVVGFTVAVGAITFTGSMVAWAKLAGKISGKPMLFPSQKMINAAVGGSLLLMILLLTLVASGNLGVGYAIVILALLLALTLGVLGVLPIGGGDMPVVISLLNSLSGIAASAAGFVINNTVLVVAGCLVGASGLILTIIMCKGMNRTLRNVLFSGFGATTEAEGEAVEGELKPITVDDAYYILEAAQKVLFVPGYGMAVAQAQHAVKELGGLLEDNGAEVLFAIHPVAGRMPGHMNVLLAEADVPYEQLSEMDNVNPQMETFDVAIVIGANDVVNPAAAQDQSSPIYGMPIIEVHRAKTTFVLKRGAGTGFSGLQNRLFLMPNTRMLYGDAKASISALVSQFKEG